MSDTEAPPTNPNPTPPPESYEDEHLEDPAARFARLAGHMVRDSLAPLEASVGELGGKFDQVLDTLRKIFDRTEAVAFELSKRLEVVERRMTKAEHAIDEIRERLGLE